MAADFPSADNMDNEIKEKLLWRATIAENSESLVKSCSRNDKMQLSLFEETKQDTIQLKIPDNINYDELIEKETEALGVSLTYSFLDKYILHYKAFCNNNIESVNNLTESKSNVVFIGKITKIEYRTSDAGNYYAKIYFKDDNSECRAYLFGSNYGTMISRAFKGVFYLIESSYDKNRESLSIVKFKALDEVNINEFVTNIFFHVNSIENIVLLRYYVFNNIIGTQFNLFYVYNENVIKAPYKIDFNESIYFKIKQLLTNITIK